MRKKEFHIISSENYEALIYIKLYLDGTINLPTLISTLKTKRKNICNLKPNLINIKGK